MAVANYSAAGGYMARRAARQRRQATPIASVQQVAEITPSTNGHVAEIIGRTAHPSAQASLYKARMAVRTIDETVPDYAYWDNLRRCKLPGYKMGGLFAKRVERVLAAWIFGEGVDVVLNKDIAQEYPEESVKYTNEQLKNFIGGLLDSGQDNEGDDPDLDDQSGAILLNIFMDAAGLGDQYLIINADGSVSVPSPDTVEVIRDELDYRRVLAIRITTKLEKVTIIDEYRADGRTVTYRTYTNGKPVDRTETYANLIGRISCVHVAHGRTGNEIYGHSIHEELRPLYDQYDDVLEKMLDGVKLLGNPFLAFTGLKDIGAVVDLNQPQGAPETYVDANGSLQERPMMNIDRNSVFAIGEGGDAKFVAPPVGFTEDTKTALNVLFWLLFEHLGIPESLWGGELSSARATSETQLSQFVKELRGWQQENGGWVVRLCKIWLSWRALTDPQIIVDKLTAEWPAAIEEDKELLLKFIELARNNNLLTDEMTLKLMELVEDAADEAKKAKEQATARADDEQQRTIDVAKAMPQRGAVGEMTSNTGYNVAETTAIVQGAIRQEAERMIAGG